MGYEPKTFIITAASYNAGINRKFLQSLEKYAKEHDAEILILPMLDGYLRDGLLHPELNNYSIIPNGFNLNKKIRVQNFNVRPQQIDPTTGLARFTQSDVTTVFASPKQRMRVIPNSVEKLPKVLMTTGAITTPLYKQDRLGRIGEKDHIYGAVVVETIDDIFYHYRAIQATGDGEFIDLGRRYGMNGISDAKTEALVPGDWHVGDTNPEVRQATFDMLKTLSPKRLMLHDFFNGHSINHHEQGKLATRAQTHQRQTLSLEEEILVCGKELYAIREQTDADIYIVRSNHDEFLDRYLEETRFITDPQNALLASKLLTELINEKNPLEEAIRGLTGIPEGVYFLPRDKDFKVRGWHLGNHGDKGANGAKGLSMRSKEFAYGKSITGHRHSPEILRDTYVVGTSTHLKLPYTKTGGPSSWMNTHAVLYENGKCQLVNIIDDGKWRKE